MKVVYTRTQMYTGHGNRPPTWVRAPGAVRGMFALECALDDLASARVMAPSSIRASRSWTGRTGRR